MQKLNPEKLAAQVIGYKNGIAVKGKFGLDTAKYNWVDDYMEDLSLRKRRAIFQESILEARQRPIHRDELRKMFEKQIDEINRFRINQLAQHLSEVQSRSSIMLNELNLENLRVDGAWLIPHMVKLTKKELDAIFSALPEGSSKAEISEAVEALEADIKKIDAKLVETESIKSRWIYNEKGDPLPYPNGCRWTQFVKTWELVAGKFRGAVDVEGYSLTTDREHYAYERLELGRVRKHDLLFDPR